MGFSRVTSWEMKDPNPHSSAPPIRRKETVEKNLIFFKLEWYWCCCSSSFVGFCNRELKSAHTFLEKTQGFIKHLLLFLFIQHVFLLCSFFFINVFLFFECRKCKMYFGCLSVQVSFRSIASLATNRSDLQDLSSGKTLRSNSAQSKIRNLWDEAVCTASIKLGWTLRSSERQVCSAVTHHSQQHFWKSYESLSLKIQGCDSHHTLRIVKNYNTQQNGLLLQEMHFVVMVRS